MKSSRQSIEKSNELLTEVLYKIPGVTLRNKSVTTSSIYCKTPDGYSLRIGDHAGKEKYRYRWNLDPTRTKSAWEREKSPVDGRQYWRYYTSSVDDLAKAIAHSIEWLQENASKAYKEN